MRGARHNPGGLVIFGNKGRENPGALVIFGNPKRRKIRNAEKIPDRWLQGRTLWYERQGQSPKEALRLAVADWQEQARLAKGNQGEVSETQQAVAVYRDFHGHDPREILELQRSAAMRLDYAGLGPLLGMGFAMEGVDPPSPDRWDEYPLAVRVERESGLVLASNAGGTQLYAIGGAQAQFLEVARELGLDIEKDILELGPLAFVVYEDQKPGDPSRTEYVHAFDEPQPTLGFDRLKEEIFFAGGVYRVEGLWLHR